jgi:hypothetical protein
LLSINSITKNNKIFFKFNDVNIQNGDISLKVRFVEDGNFKGQIRSTDNIAIALASFNIPVPLQPFGKFNTDSLGSSLIPVGLVAAIGISVLVIVLILISRKGKGRQNHRRREKEDRKPNGDI